ncbi:Tetratrico peptide repeat-containing protein [Oceanobacillus limi]|uniref:Tetratrico peptide repeat-containing protein n=1 Tax=Oceanobacillus limi TaxID=930131 RepID=A0A1H9Y3G7_9BACI|nr:tetratricopeptide repeat protein [Oceanobacillus limi]SES63392.1 Tetratrico peptide repeat-containing protein [Oceanobacillus limi]
MKRELDKAIKLRSNGDYKGSNNILQRLAEEFPESASVNYQCAWSFDLMGEEAKAVAYYEKAISLGLPSKEMEGALIGLGSTYRTLGEYEKSKSTLLKGMEQFPNNNAIKTFYAMTLYNLNEHQEAMELILTCLTNTTKDTNILSYKRAIDFYSDKLDEVWE